VNSKSVPLIVIAFALLAAPVPEAEACSCFEPGPPCQAYWTTDVIFRGRVESISRPADRTVDPHQFVMVRFTLLETFKGIEGATVEVRTPTGPASCALRFSKGREYVVHASRVNGVISTSSCSRTARVERAAEDLEFARNIASGGVPLGRISGRVVLRSRSLWSSQYHTRPMRDVPVTLRRGDDFSVTIRTNRSGEYVASGLEAGTYSIAVEPTGRFRVEARPDGITLADVRGCAVAEVDVHPDGRVTGRVVDSTGNPVRGLTVDLTAGGDPDVRKPPLNPERLQTATRLDGSYEFTGVPSGRFIVGINTRPDSVVADARVFHPGVTRAADATVVTLPAGGEVELRDLTVPSTISFVEITGVIFDSDRVPVEGARVYLRGPAERDFILTAPVVTDLSGRFTITAVADQEYVVFAERPSRNARGRLDSTNLVRVIATPTHARLQLTLRPPH
jgi:hypothetical protein